MTTNRKSKVKKGRGFTPVEVRTRKEDNKSIPLPRKQLTLISLLVLVVISSAIGGFYYYNKSNSGTETTTASGLRFTDLQEGTGATPTRGRKVKVHYTGTLKDGTKFDSSVDRNSPFEFTFGVGQVIKGWDEGLATMKTGGKRKLIIPPDLGYGQNSNGKIPANSTLYFDVELLEVN